MLKNYLRIAFRHLRRHRVFSIINILGLTVGMTASLLIFLYVHFELSYDNFHPNADRLYRLVCDTKTPSETMHEAVTSAPMAINIKRDFPEVEAAIRIEPASLLVRKGEIKYQEDETLFADSSLLTAFNFPLVKGNPKTALTAPFSIILSETAVKKYFGNTDPIGQTVLLTEGSFPSTITGVMKDMPENAHFRADMLVSMTTFTARFDSAFDSQWGNFGVTSYLLLKPGTNPKALETKLPAFLQRHDGKEMQESQMFFSLYLEPLRDIYLHSKRRDNMRNSQSGNSTNIYIFTIIGIFILLIAAINFINLTTARSVERAREVGIRKVIGARQEQLTSQFLGESIITCLIAWILSTLLCFPLISVFNQLAGKTVSTGLLHHPSYIFILLGIALAIGALAGAYPALVLSSFKPIMVLKGNFSTGTKGTLLRKILVVTQFTISIALIIGTLVVYSQLHYMRNQDLGFSNEETMVIDTHGDAHKLAMQEEINRIPGVISTTMSSSIPGSGHPIAYSSIQNKKGDMQIANLDLYFVDWDFIKQYNLKVVAGRAFSKEFLTDTTQSMILNESAVRAFGYASPQEAIGRKFDQWGRKGNIIGVIKDFHAKSLQQEIQPLTLRIEPEGCNLLSIKVKTANLPNTIATIGEKWRVMIPKRPFTYYFADEFFDRQYRTEDRFGRLFLNFAILAIFISCLGLLGLASYSTLQRTREIGIRKVLGAGIGSIVNLLSIQFLQLVIVAFIIASPIAWFFMHQWLQGFAYRINIGWWIFALSGITAVLIAMITISFQAVRAALLSPVISLRSE